MVSKPLAPLTFPLPLHSTGFAIIAVAAAVAVAASCASE